MDRVHAAVAAAVDGRRGSGDILRSLSERFREADVMSALRELATLGFIVVGEPVRWTSRDLATVVPAFLSLVEDRFDLFEMPLPDSPAYFFAAAPRADADPLLPQAARRAGGRGAAAAGFTRADALLRCLGQAAELVAACWHGDEAIEIACFNELRGRAIAPNDLMGYSEQQYRDRDAWNAVHAEYERIPPPLDTDTPVAWTPARDLAGGDTLLIPAAFAFIGFRDDGLDESFYVADSNGCAVGASEADADERGFLEVVERDATGLWWYGQRRCPAVHEESVAAADIDDVITWHRGSRRSLAFLNITSDLGVPVAVAVSANPDGSHVMLGFGAHFEMGRAVAKAMAELVQMEMGAAMMGVGAGPDSELETLPPGLRHWLTHASLSDQVQLQAATGIDAPPSHTCETPAQNIPDWIAANDRRVLALRRGRPGGTSMFSRVALPRTAHYRCRFGSLRWRDALAATDPSGFDVAHCLPLSI